VTYPPYVSAENNENPFATIWAPPIQGLAKAFFTPHMAPTPVATRLPQPDRTSDTVNGFLRIEAAGGSLQPDAYLFNCDITLYSYSPANEESLGELIMMRALAKGGNAAGQAITHPSLQKPWYVTYSRISGLAIKLNDPVVSLAKFRGQVTWRIQGQPDPLPADPDPLQ